MINVAFLTTWGSKCGISTYSEDLCECLTDTGEVRIQVIAPMEEDSCMSAPEQIPFRMLWSREDHNLPYSIPAAAKGCSIVHVQHEYGLFQHHESFINLLKMLRKKEFKVVVTLHTVFPYGTWRSGLVDGVRSNADAVIVHTAEANAAVLLARGKSRVFLVQHGTRINAAKGNRQTGLDFIGIPKAFQSASFGGSVGFISPGKNIHETIKAWSDGANRRLIDPSRSGFIIVGDLDDKVYFYRNVIESHRRDCGYAENIFLRYKFIPRDMMCHVMAALDYAVLNTTSDTLSASGQVHVLASHGVPFAAADRPIYRDAINAGAIPFNVSSKNGEYTLSSVNAISALASNDGLREDMAKKLDLYKEKTGWPVQASRHLEIYKELLK